MPTPITTGNWGKALDGLVDDLFHDDLKKTSQMYTRYFNVGSMDKAQLKHLTGVGLEDWRESGETVAANFTENLQGFTKNYVPTVWKSGFSISRELQDDADFAQIANDSAKLARTAIRTIDKEAAKMLNNSTNTTYFTGADGLALVTASHTREDSGTVIPNNATGALNETNFETAMVRFEEMLDGRGELVDLNPSTLLVPPALAKEANILIKSGGRVATGDNDMNPYMGAVTVESWKRIGAAGGGSDTQWYLLDNAYNKAGKGLNIFMRVSPEINSEVELETGVRKYVGYMRFAEGFTDFRGVQHSTGTA